MADLLRFHEAPRKCWYRASYDKPLTPKELYYYEKSKERYWKTPDGIALASMDPIKRGELGSFSGVNIYYG